MWKRIWNSDHHHLLAEVVGHVYGIKVYHDDRAPMIKIWTRTSITALILTNNIKGDADDLLPDLNREFVRLQKMINLLGFSGPDYIAETTEEGSWKPSSNGG